jgi:hypothetical protein
MAQYKSLTETGGLQNQFNSIQAPLMRDSPEEAHCHKQRTKSRVFREHARVPSNVIQSHINCVKVIERVQRVSRFGALEIEPHGQHVITHPLSTVLLVSV